MTSKRVIECDTCGKQDRITTDTVIFIPIGWIVIKDDKGANETMHFCSVKCAIKYLKSTLYHGIKVT